MQFDFHALQEAPQIRQRLLQWLPQQRWFASKSHAVSGVSIADAVVLSESADAARLFALFEIEFVGKSSELYAAPIAVTRAGDEFAVVECLEASLWLSFLNRLLVTEQSLPTIKGGKFCGAVTRAFNADALLKCSVGDVHVHAGQQTNTSVSIGASYFMKLFRRPQCGQNPEAEIGVFLAEHNFANTPAVVATITYRPASSTSSSEDGERCLAIMSQRLAAECEAWPHCVGLVTQFWRRLAKCPTRLANAPQPVDWRINRATSTQLLDAELTELMSESLATAALLGRRTAELHRTLALGTSTDFVPEALTSPKLAEIVELVRHEITATANLMKAQDAVVQQVGASRFAAELTPRSTELLNSLSSHSATPDALLIRVHGDYHLGQVLRANGDFFIVDFEGEPDRPLAERRLKRPAVKDVAGMLRSFHYAANFVDPRTLEGLEQLNPETDRVGWQEFWYSHVALQFMQSYCDGIADTGLLPQDPSSAQQLLDLFLLEKALYELRYELNNRPDWARIPIGGLSQILGITR